MENFAFEDPSHMIKVLKGLLFYILVFKKGDLFLGDVKVPSISILLNLVPDEKENDIALR